MTRSSSSYYFYAMALLILSLVTALSTMILSQNFVADGLAGVVIALSSIGMMIVLAFKLCDIISSICNP